jgi:predicted alpha-1,2-mannosidase
MMLRPFIATLVMVMMCTAAVTAQDLTRYVDPITGTGGVGHTYPGATLPYAMVQLSPDTRRDGSWEGCSGYYHADSLIYGFTHTHLSGTGCSDYGDILLMPRTRTVPVDPKRYASRYRHSDEVAQPGYYAVTLTDDDVRVELTATTRIGMHRYTFPADARMRTVVLDLRHRDKTLAAELRLVSPTRIEGYRRSEAWARDQHVYFVMEFSEPLTACTVPGRPRMKLGSALTSNDIAALLTFRATSSPLLVKVGISSVDIQGAHRNLVEELPHWDFERVRREATRAWNNELGRIVVRGGTDAQLQNFYTSLYHTMVVPNVMSDVDGRYRGRDDKIHTAVDHTQYTVFSLWDTFRAAHPLYTLIDSVRTRDYVRTFLTQYQQGGRLPVWELSANETDCMIGYHSIPVITDALVKGITDFDTTLALNAMMASATWNHLGLPAYMARGYIGVDDEHESVSKTLEYAFDDWCISEVARMLGRTDVMQTYARRAASYRNIYDPESGFMRPRRNGDWLARFDPREVNNHYTEANSWQYSFFVPHDIPGMTTMMGGPDATERKLDALFTAPTSTTGRTQADITGLIGQYAHGNEPSHHMAYLYNYIGKPWKTQRLVRQIMDSLYATGPQGLPGNEDCGQMSAWYVWSALGLYPVTPGSPYYAIGSPLFDTARVAIGTHSVNIIAQRDTPASIYVRDVLIDGVVQHTNLIAHHDLVRAREVRFVMCDQPYQQRGTTIEHRGALDASSFVHAPRIRATNRLFTDSAQVSIVGENVRYSINGDSLVLPLQYTGPITIASTSRIHARAYNGADSSGVTTAEYFRIPSWWEVKLNSVPNPQYLAEGPISMIDGVRGSVMWRKGDWHGIQGSDMDVEIHMDSVRTISSVAAGFLQDVRPWIVYPRRITIMTSQDGHTWNKVATATHRVPVTDMQAQTMTMSATFAPVRTRFVRVIATTYGKLPAWHPGAGEDAFIFCDEVLVK